MEMVFIGGMKTTMAGFLNGDGLHWWDEDHFGWFFEWRWSSLVG
jgi:hypothetical protein